MCLCQCLFASANSFICQNTWFYFYLLNPITVWLMTSAAASGKYHIHKSRTTNSVLNFRVFNRCETFWSISLQSPKSENEEWGAFVCQKCQNLFICIFSSVIYPVIMPPLPYNLTIEVIKNILLWTQFDVIFWPDVTLFYFKDFWGKTAESVSTESGWTGKSRTSRYSKRIFMCFPTLYGNICLLKWIKWKEWYVLIRLNYYYY